MDEHQPDQTYLPVTPEQTLETTMTRLAVIDQELTVPYELAEKFLVEIGEGSSEELHRQVASQVAALDHKPTERQETSMFLQTLRGAIPQSDPERIQVIDSGVRLLSEADELEATAGVLATQEFQATRQRLLDSTDWDSITTKHLASESYEDLHDLFGALNKTFADQPMSLEYRMHNLKSLQVWQTRITEQSDTLAPDTKNEESESPQLSPKDIQAWAQSVESVTSYLSRKREDFVREILPRSELDKLQNLYYSGLVRSEADLDQMPSVITHALEKQFHKMVGDFHAKDSAYLRVDTAARPNTIFFSGQNLLEESTNISNTSQWLHQRMTRHPPALTAGLGNINFVSNIPARKGSTTEETDEWVVSGRMRPSYNTLLILATPIEPPQGIDMPEEQLTPILQELNAKRISAALDHELTHYVHFHRLPVKWLQEWNQITLQEPYNVTGYVEKRRSENHNHSDSEDLAESTSLYYNQPAQLYTEAPLRFKALNKRDKRYPQRLLDFIDIELSKTEQPPSMSSLDTAVSEVADILAAQKAAKQHTLKEGEGMLTTREV